MSDGAVDQVRRELLDDNKVYTQAELEELRRSNPKDETKGGLGHQAAPTFKRHVQRMH